MHDARTQRLRRAFFAAVGVVVLGAVIVTGVAGPAAGRVRDPAKDPLPLKNLKLGLGCWESGGRYDIVNKHSGALGKYQIMPANWPAWARKYIGSGKALLTPANQEIVATGKLTDLYGWLDYWRRVVYWWLTGDDERDSSKWSEHATRYVNGVLALAERSMTREGRRHVPRRCLAAPADGAGPIGGGPPSSSSVHFRKVFASALWIRTGPGLENPHVGVLDGGSVVKVLERQRDTEGHLWIRIPAPGGASHWVARWWTRLVDGPAAR